MEKCSSYNNNNNNYCFLALWLKKWQKEKRVVECCTDSTRDVVFCFLFFCFCFFFCCFFKRALTRATDPAAPPTGRWEWKKSAVQLLECKTSRRTNKTACNSAPQISCTKLAKSHKRHHSRAAHFALIPKSAGVHHAVKLQSDSVLTNANLTLHLHPFSNYYIQSFIYFF